MNKDMCVLPKERRIDVECKKSDCSTCGWNAEESERRRKYIKTHGLKKDEKGLYGLVKASDIRNENTFDSRR